ncbi:MAG: lipoate--protein ligase family protein [Chloroherpetonaceae bacterium]|nr:lipoate--protein ligase family protein [Chloroherpetonaceae bacterium]
MFGKIFLIDSGAHHGAFQMWLDEALALHFAALEARFGKPLVLLRFYQWSPFCVSLGYHQKETSLDFAALQHDGIDWVRRPTGGRAVFHADELTYAVVMRTRHSNADCYAAIAQALRAGLCQLGIEAHFQRRQPDLRARYASEESLPCFTASARDELEVKGKKIIGSAQRRYGDILLQHGSILLSPKHRELTKYLCAHPDVKARIAQDLIAKTTSVAECLGQDVSYREAVSAFSYGFYAAWQASLSVLPESALLEGAA